MRGGGGGGGSGGGAACEQCHQLLLQGGRALVVCQPVGQRGGASGTMESASWCVGGEKGGRGRGGVGLRQRKGQTDGPDNAAM